jgi:hypothetical protein
LLHDLPGNGLASDFFNHPLIFSLFPGDYAPGSTSVPGLLARAKNLPSYIPSANFAAALLDLAARGPTKADVVDSAQTSFGGIRENVIKLGNPAVQRVVLMALDRARGDINQAKRILEDWYDSAMDRVSGRYRRSTQLIVFLLGFAIALGFNVDTISLADSLYRNQTVRGAIVAQAQVASSDATFLKSNYQDVRNQIDAIKLPIGWGRSPRPSSTVSLDSIWAVYVLPVLGWLLTAFAITLGAPFWFDVLNKIMIIRSTVKPHEKGPEEAPDDRGPGGSPSWDAIAAAQPQAARLVPGRSETEQLAS